MYHIYIILYSHCFHSHCFHCYKPLSRSYVGRCAPIQKLKLWRNTSTNLQICYKLYYYISFRVVSLSVICSALLFQPLDLVKTQLQSPIKAGLLQHVWLALVYIFHCSIQLKSLFVRVCVCVFVYTDSTLKIVIVYWPQRICHINSSALLTMANKLSKIQSCYF